MIHLRIHVATRTLDSYLFVNASNTLLNNCQQLAVRCYLIRKNMSVVSEIASIEIVKLRLMYKDVVG